MREREFDKKIIKLMNKKKIATMAEIRDKVPTSISTIRRALEKEGYLTSCSHNGVYYALKKEIKFDQNGLFMRNGIMFSCSGGLKQTILDKINNSKAGLSSSEISSVLGDSGKSVLSQLHVNDKVQSQVFGEKRYYFTAEKERRLEQITERIKLYELECREDEKLSHEIILFVMAQCFSTKNLPAKRIYNKLKNILNSITLEDVKKIMKMYELNGIKKKL
jgi:hypothetical protein